MRGRVPRDLRPGLECREPALPGDSRAAERPRDPITGHGRAVEQAPCVHRTMRQRIAAGLALSGGSRWSPRLSAQARSRRGAADRHAARCRSGTDGLPGRFLDRHDHGPPGRHDSHRRGLGLSHGGRVASQRRGPDHLPPARAAEIPGSRGAPIMSFRSCAIATTLSLTLCAGRGQPAEPAVTITVDVSKPGGPLRPAWRFFRYDEPNYTYMKDGKALLADLATLGPQTGPGSKRGNKSPIDSPFLERLFPPCCGSLKWRTPFHGGNRHGLPGYFVRLGHAM